MLNVNKNGGGGDGMMRPSPNSGCSSTTSSMSSATDRSAVPCLQLCCFGWLQSLDQFIGGNNNGGGGTLASSSPHKQLQQRRQCSSSASTGGTPASVAAAQQRADAGVAIDSKIEQAMDLVKTHLIYAVRDEIEMLRSRIVQLETTVVQLERENAQLREFVPHEVLASLCLLDQQAVGQPQPNLLLNKVPSSPAGFAKTVPTAAAAAAAAIVQ